MRKTDGVIGVEKEMLEMLLRSVIFVNVSG
jgi:hypothetical protein